MTKNQGEKMVFEIDKGNPNMDFKITIINLD